MNVGITLDVASVIGKVLVYSLSAYLRNGLTSSYKRNVGGSYSQSKSHDRVGCDVWQVVNGSESCKVYRHGHGRQ